jgi:hypothetical protein
MRRELFAGLAVLVFSAPAGAAILESYNIRGWSIYAYSNDQTREFSHCAMASTYKSGITLMFSLNNSGKWTMGLFNNDWSLTPGKKYNFDIRIDRSHGENWFGYANSPQLIEIPLPNSESLFEKFRRSEVLTINAANGTFSFYLTNSSEALQSMAVCAERHRRAVASNPFEKPKNPFEAPPQQAEPEPLQPKETLQTQAAPAPSEAELYAEATVTTVSMLAAAGAKGYKILPVDKVKAEFEGHHAVWTALGSAGALQILTEPESLETITSSLIAKAASDCKGKFATGKGFSKSTPKIEVACEQQDGKVLTYFHVIVPRPAGGSYIFTVYSADDSPASHDEASKLSDTILTSQEVSAGRPGQKR